MIVDLRSDTVTLPSEKMRAAMAAAPVGDDVYGEDPSINRLESLAAQMTGKEAALFVPSGTMGNQICVLSHTRRGEEIILDVSAHIRHHEVGAAALLSGVGYYMLRSEKGDGILSLSDLASAIRENDIHEPRTSLLCLENATAMGRVVPLTTMEALYGFAKEHGLSVHLDGARLFNAALHLGVPASSILRYTDSAMFCLSKGLGAPVGSMVVGSAEFIQKARKYRKLLGGGMRQAGILAAAGIIALEDGVARLHEDHENLKRMAAAAKEAGIPSLFPPEINVAFLDVTQIGWTPEGFSDYMATCHIKINPVDKRCVRVVTNLNVVGEKVDRVVDTFRSIAGVSPR